MKGLNQVNLIGNIGNEPEMRFTPNGKPVTKFSLATGRKYKNDSGGLVEETEWHNIVTWGTLAETCNKSLSKGAAVFVSGRIHYRKWESDDKQKHERAEIIAQEVIFLDKPAARAGADQPADGEIDF